MPKPSASSPPHRSRHIIANTSPARYDVGQVLVGDPAEEPHPVVEPERGPRALEPRAGPARRRRSRAARRPRAARPRRAGRRSPCAARAGSHRATMRPVGIEAERDARRRAARVAIARRREPVDVDARRDHERRQRSRPRRAPPRAPGTPPPRRHRPRRAAPAPSSGALPGSRPGTVISAPWSTTTHGAARRRRTEPAERQRGSTKITSAPTSRASASTRRASAGVGQQHRLARALDPERLLPRPTPRSPAYGVVSTVVSAGGSRRHSS